MPEVISRRTFLGGAAAAAALAAAGCGDRRLAVPLARRTPEAVPGLPVHYASTCPLGQRALAVLVRTREGRPVHIAGNDAHPDLRGAACAQAMAGIQTLYGPGRVDGPRLDGARVDWTRATAALREALAPLRAGGKGLLLMGATASPSRLRFLQELRAALPGLEHLAWEPGLALGAQAGALAAFGRAALLRPVLDRARCILTLGADPFDGSDPAAARAFAAARRDPAAPVRLWSLEGPVTLTGSNADHRLAVRPSRLAAVAFALARDLHARHGRPLPPGAVLPDLPAPELTGPFRSALASDLAEAGPRAVVLCGEGLPPETQVAAHLLNAMLGSRAFRLEPAQTLAGPADLDAALARARAGACQVILAWGANPAYAAPDADGWRAALAASPAAVWIGTEADETSGRCRLLLPEHHWLEAWGDHRDGGYELLQQPAVGPLYDSRQGEDILAAALAEPGAPAPAHLDRIRARWRAEVHPLAGPVPFLRFFQAALHEGVVEGRPDPPAPPFRGGCVAEAVRAAAAAAPAGFDLALHAGPGVGDGRFGASGWLQELPDPIHKTTWGAPLLIAPADAQRLGLAEGDQAWIQAGGVRVLAPLHLQPGQAEGTLALALGYGRKAGPARGIGVCAFPFTGLRGPSPFLVTGTVLSKGRGRLSLPATRGRDPLPGETPARHLRRADLPGLVREDAHHPSLYPHPAPAGPRWGMAIDLTACLGCPGCVVACQSENNVPVVGPEQVARGREMHWLRIDTAWDPEGAVHQPMLCQHCGDAPCESVCPVNATNHSPEGLNQMVYNRCVGVRYCANNCPYKVRRFNFLEYNGTKAEPELLAFNPDVTVRPRGVMEKCTFCVQRIQDAHQRAGGEGRPIRDGEVVPACAAACPTEAIVFGDLADPGSRAARLSADPRGYHVLEDLGTRPAITYLARVRNPHPALSGGRP